jgi:hypothetical protein
MRLKLFIKNSDHQLIQNTNCKGAVLVEFAMISFLLFLIISAIVQFSLAFFNYTLLSDGLTSSLRNISVSTMTTDTSVLTNESMPESIQARTREYMVSKNFIKDGSLITFPSSDIKVCKKDNVCQIHVIANWRLNCVFCLIPFEPVLNIRSLIPIEDPCFVESTSCLTAPSC